MAKSKKLYRITRQGAPVINHAYVLAEHDDVVVLDIDMRSRHCDVSCTGADGDVPLVLIEAYQHSSHLHKHKRWDEMTAISFPQHKGWLLLMATISKYTLHVCLWKDRGENADDQTKG